MGVKHFQTKQWDVQAGDTICGFGGFRGTSGYFEGSHWRLHFSCMGSSKTDVGSIYLGIFHHDLTSRPSPGIMLGKGNHPHSWP